MRNRMVAPALLLLANLAQADEPPKGFYAGASFGRATLELEDSDSTADFKDNGTGYKLTAGYRFMKWLAVEAGYADYGKQEDTLLGLPLRADFHAFHVGAVGMIPLGNFDLMGKTGIGYWEGKLANNAVGVRYKEDHVDPIFGIGAQYRAGNFAIRAEAEALLLGFDDDGDDEADGDDWVDFVSLGVSWNF